ncbi:MAG: hypothetical protein C4288_11720 [Leptolyngbya sp. ERB_1_1]
MSAPPGLPPIFAELPVALVPTHQIANFPANTFLESIAVGVDGTLFFTSHLDGKVFRIGIDGIPIVHATITGKATGLVFTPDGSLLLSAWNDKTICRLALSQIQTLVSPNETGMNKGKTAAGGIKEPIGFRGGWCCASPSRARRNGFLEIT